MCSQAVKMPLVCFVGRQRNWWGGRNLKLLHGWNVSYSTKLEDTSVALPLEGLALHTSGMQPLEEMQPLG